MTWVHWFLAVSFVLAAYPKPLIYAYSFCGVWWEHRRDCVQCWWTR